MRRALFAFLLSALFFPFSWPQGAPPQKAPDAFEPPDLAGAEKALFSMVNCERQKENLPLLRWSSALALLARKHSADMAGQGKLSHVSSAGESHIERLVREGLFFSHSGENVARSDTPSPRWIHGAFMNSPEHRENIMSPQFDTMGIGIKQSPEGQYFVTQDFLRRIEPKDEARARADIIAKVLDIRAVHNLPPIPFSERIHLQAQLFSRAKSLGKTSLRPPEELGETHVFFITTPSLEELGQVDSSISRNTYEEGGVGVEFERSKEYPGGAYFVALMLLPTNRYQILSHEERIKVVLDALNNLRLEKGLNRLELALDASAEAQKISSAQSEQKFAAFLSPYGGKAAHIVYYTEDLAAVPGVVKDKVLVRSLKKAGVGIQAVRPKEYPRGIFIVTIIPI